MRLMCPALTIICLFVCSSGFLSSDFYLKGDVMHLSRAIGRLRLKIHPYGTRILELGGKTIFKNPAFIKTAHLSLYYSPLRISFHGTEDGISLTLTGGSEHIFRIEHIQVNQNIQTSASWRTASPRSVEKCSFKWRKNLALNFQKILR